MNQNTLLNILADMSLNDMTEAEDIRYALIDLAECAEVDEMDGLPTGHDLCRIQRA